MTYGGCNLHIASRGKLNPLFFQAQENNDRAREKQTKDFITRKSKGVKTFNLQAGQEVMKLNKRKDTRKGDRMEDNWTGRYR